MQAATLHRVASRLGIIASPSWPLTTLVIPIVEEAVLETGSLHAYRSDAERIEDLQEFRGLVNAIADDYLPENEPTDNKELEMQEKENTQSQLCALKQELAEKDRRLSRLERLALLLIDVVEENHVGQYPLAINPEDREFLKQIIPY